MAEHVSPLIGDTSRKASPEFPLWLSENESD